MWNTFFQTSSWTKFLVVPVAYTQISLVNFQEVLKSIFVLTVVSVYDLFCLPVKEMVKFHSSIYCRADFPLDSH